MDGESLHFASEIGFWAYFTAFIYLFSIIGIIWSIKKFYTQKKWKNIIGFIIMAFALLFCLVFHFKVSYILNENELAIKQGIFTFNIKYSDIHSVKADTFFFAGFPSAIPTNIYALSGKGVSIRDSIYPARESIFISPKNRELFLTEIEKRIGAAEPSSLEKQINDWIIRNYDRLEEEALQRLEYNERNKR
jgi:signal transduction histidine kinase